MTILSARSLGLGPTLGPIDLHLSAGDCLAVVGTNGAGKSTLLALLAGALRPDRGVIDRPPALAYLPEACPLDPGVPGRRWLHLMASQPGWDAALAARVLEALPLPLDRGVEALSLGQRSRLGLALCLPRRLPLLILDDPFLGLDPVAQEAAQRLIAEVADASQALVFATAKLGSAARLCTHLAALRGPGDFDLRPIADWEAAAQGRGLGAALGG